MKVDVCFRRGHRADNAAAAAGGSVFLVLATYRGTHPSVEVDGTLHMGGAWSPGSGSHTADTGPVMPPPINANW